MDKIYLLDASSYLYKAYFAIHQMTNDKGMSTNALFGFVRSVLKLIKDFHPTHLVAVFDGYDNTLQRRTLYPAYKAHRQTMPKDLREQITLAQHFCQHMGIAQLNVPHVEADDTLGSIAIWAASQNATAYLCTNDKDFCQLISDRILLLNSFKENQICGIEQVKEQFGVLPHQMIDFLAITGDASDNVPGVSGFGPKTAAALLQQFGSLDTILQHIEEIPGKKKQETLYREREQALLSRRLVTIQTDVPFPHETDFFKLAQPDLSALHLFYTEVNFTTLLRKLDREENLISTPCDNIKQTECYYLVDEEHYLQELVQELMQHREICVDTETNDIHPLRAELVGIGLGVKAGQAWYIPVNSRLGLITVVNALKPLFTNPKIGFYGHNIKYDYHVLARHGITIANICFDSLLASYLLNSHRRQHSLDHLSLEMFGKVKIDIQDLIGKGKKQLKMSDVPVNRVCEYCCEDVDYTIRLKDVLAPQLIERGMEKLFYTIELPLITVLAKMESYGIFVDVNYLKEISVYLQHEISHLSEYIYQMAGETFNLNSPKQLSHILFDKLAIIPPKNRASSHSTNAEVLEVLQRRYPIAKLLLDYRLLEKLRSTYVDSLPKEVDRCTQRIHCQFNQSGTSTGRLACHNPNLQNIPIRSEIGSQIRQAFRPQKAGWSYLSADYSQIELRLLAHLSGDPVLLKAFQLNEDIHIFTASQIFGIPMEMVTKEQRMQAKTVNFGIIYGQQAFGLSQELGIDNKTASIFIEKYFQRYNKVKEFIELQKQQAHTTGKVTTSCGRERLLPEINSKNKMIVSAAERLAVNTPIQGSQADLIKLAMLAIDHELNIRGLQAYMILQIHDELIFEAPNEEIDILSKLVRTAMKGVMQLKVPLVVDIHVGKNWKEC